MNGTTSGTGGRKKRRSELAHFLRNRRARLSPETVGLASAERRARAGLRREEVAVLAGVSASWYTWLEQGRPVRFSSGMLDAISRALRLNELERVYLYRLADANPPVPVARVAAPSLASYQEMVEAHSLGPSCVIDRYWDLLAVNRSAGEVLKLGREANDNYLTSLFTGPHGRAYLNWDSVARRMTARFRVQASYVPEDSHYDQVAEQLSRDSRQFAEMWARHEVDDFTSVTAELGSSHGDSATYALVTMNLDEAVGHRLLAYIPPDAAGWPETVAVDGQSPSQASPGNARD